VTGDGLPETVVDEVERLTRLARAATDPDEAEAYRADRETLLAEYGFAARVRDDETGETLVCYPAEWLSEGTIRIDAVEDVSRGVEIPLSGTASDEDWEAVDAHNRDVVAKVAERHGEPHAATARALADFASNHYAKPIEALTDAECREFRTDYLPRNAWPSDEQRAHAEESVRLARSVAREKESSSV
jgi:hypothetical protein